MEAGTVSRTTYDRNRYLIDDAGQVITDGEGNPIPNPNVGVITGTWASQSLPSADPAISITQTTSGQYVDGVHTTTTVSTAEWTFDAANNYYPHAETTVVVTDVSSGDVIRTVVRDSTYFPNGLPQLYSTTSTEGGVITTYIVGYDETTGAGISETTTQRNVGENLPFSEEGWVWADPEDRADPAVLSEWIETTVTRQFNVDGIAVSETTITTDYPDSSYSNGVENFPVTNNVPTITAPADVTLDENASVDIDLSGTASDVDVGDTLTINIDEAPTNGTINIDVATGVVTYTPDVNFTGDDRFSYTVSDGSLVSEPVTVNLTVEPAVAPGATVPTFSDTQIALSPAAGQVAGYPRLTFDSDLTSNPNRTATLKVAATGEGIRLFTGTFDPATNQFVFEERFSYGNNGNGWRWIVQLDPSSDGNSYYIASIENVDWSIGANSQSATILSQAFAEDGTAGAFDSVDLAWNAADGFTIDDATGVSFVLDVAAGSTGEQIKDIVFGPEGNTTPVSDLAEAYLQASPTPVLTVTVAYDAGLDQTTVETENAARNTTRVDTFSGNLSTASPAPTTTSHENAWVVSVISGDDTTFGAYALFLYPPGGNADGRRTVLQRVVGAQTIRDEFVALYESIDALPGYANDVLTPDWHKVREGAWGVNQRLSFSPPYTVIVQYTGADSDVMQRADIFYHNFLTVLFDFDAFNVAGPGAPGDTDGDGDYDFDDYAANNYTPPVLYEVPSGLEIPVTRYFTFQTVAASGNVPAHTIETNHVSTSTEVAILDGQGNLATRVVYNDAFTDFALDGYFDATTGQLQPGPTLDYWEVPLVHNGIDYQFRIFPRVGANTTTVQLMEGHTGSGTPSVIQNFVFNGVFSIQEVLAGQIAGGDAIGDFLTSSSDPGSSLTVDQAVLVAEAADLFAPTPPAPAVDMSMNDTFPTSDVGGELSVNVSSDGVLEVGFGGQTYSNIQIVNDAAVIDAGGGVQLILTFDTDNTGASPVYFLRAFNRKVTVGGAAFPMVVIYHHHEYDANGVRITSVFIQAEPTLINYDMLDYATGDSTTVYAHGSTSPEMFDLFGEVVSNTDYDAIVQSIQTYRNITGT